MNQYKKSNLSKITEQNHSINFIHNENEKARLAKHEKLILMIKQYSRTIEEEQKLERLKLNTIKQINFRYKNSYQNENFVFPRTVNDEKQQQQLKKRGLKRNIFYDLYSQNQLIVEPNQSQFLEDSRRVRSLELVIGVKSQKTIKKFERLQTDLYGQKFTTINFKPIMKRSVTMPKKIQSNKLVLPILGKKLQNLKTQNPPTNKHLIQKLVRKKLVTEAYQSLLIKPQLKIHQRYSHIKRK